MDRSGTRSLVVDVDVDEYLEITPPAGAGADPQTVRVQMLAKSGKRARLRVVAPPGIQVRRVETKRVPEPG